MLTGIYQSVATFIVIAAFYLMDFLFIHRYDPQRRAGGTGRAWDFTVMAFGMAAALIAQPVFLPWLGFATKAPWGLVLQIAGVLLAMGALSLHAWARTHLQHFYAERVEVQGSHRVIQTGPYARIRHPIITSFFGLVIGLFLITPAITTLLTMLYTLWNFSQAARAEEKLLGQNLPEYAGYMARTSRFLPKLGGTK